MQRTIARLITAGVAAAVIVVVATLLPAAPPATLAAAEGSQSVAATQPSPSTATGQAPPGADAPAAADSSATPEIETSSARLEDVRAEQEPSPVELHVDKIGVSGAPIDPVGIEPDGAMEIPTDISRVGWYEYGPSPGSQPGSAVLTAHVDSRTQGKGVFYYLDATAAGDTIEVGMSDGTTRRFVVDEIRQIPKVDLPTGELFRRDGEPQLALITCGGEFDSSSRHYRDNIVVLATPTG